MASTSMPSIPSVPLISASPSLAISVTGSMPASPSACAAGTGVPPGSATSPSPISTSAQCASGARSPLAPSEPCSGTTGVIPALSSASIVSASSGRAPEQPIDERARAQQHHRPHHLGLDRRAHAGGVRAHERALQLLAALDRDRDVGERAEAGRDAVGRLLAAGQPLDHRRARLHRAPRLGRERHRRAVAGHGDDVLRRQSGAGQLDHAGWTVFRAPAQTRPVVLEAVAAVAVVGHRVGVLHAIDERAGALLGEHAVEVGEQALGEGDDVGRHDVGRDVELLACSSGRSPRSAARSCTRGSRSR